MNRIFRIGAVLMACACGAWAQQYPNELENGAVQVVDTVWETNTIWVGNATSNNLMYIFGNGRVTNNTSYIGNASSAFGNAVIVTNGAGWVMSNDLFVGDDGSENVLDVSTGSFVSSSNATVGASASASNNVMVVSGSGTRLDITDTLSIGGGSNSVAVFSGGTIAADKLTFGGNGAAFYLGNKGTFILDGALDVSDESFNWLGNGRLVMVGDLSGMEVTNGAVYLDGGRDLTLDDGTWANGTNDLIVGYNASGSELVITNGASVENQNGYIGWGTNSANNSVLVSDAGSQWRNAGGLLHLGANGATGSSLSVSDEAWVYVGEAGTNDFDAGTAGGIMVASTNSVKLIADNGASVETTGLLQLGTTNGHSGIVTITNGSSITTESLVIEGAGSVLNLDRGGEFSVGGDLDLDDFGSKFNWGNGTELSVGGAFTKADGVLDGVERNLTLDGGNWDLSSTSLTLSGSSNTLSLSNGAGVTNLNAFVGTASSNDIGNTVSVQGSGSSWLVDGTLNIGASNNSNNMVSVQSGGRIQVDALAVATNNDFNLNSGGTLAFAGGVDVPDLTNVNWKANGNLSVGGELTGMNTTSNAAGQAVVLDEQHDLTLDGSGALWNNAGTNLIIGNESRNSDLRLINGATAVNDDGYIGWGPSAGNNSVYVGNGSSWTNAGNLYVGAYWSGTNLVKAGSGNRLTVDEGGWVQVGEVVQTNYSEGLLVASTNGAELIIGKGASATVSVEDTLYLGYGTNATGSVVIGDGGTLSVGDLVNVDTNSWLDLQRGGTFAIDADFDVTDRLINSFTWGKGAKLSVGGTLTGMYTTNLVYGGSTNLYTYLGGERDLELDGSDAVWDLAGKDLVVGLQDASILTLLNGARLTNDTTYIGWGEGSTASAVDMNFGATWINSNDVWIGRGSSDNRLQILGGSTNWVGDNVYVGNTNTSGNYVTVSGSNSLWDVVGDVNLQNGTYVKNSGLLVSDNGEVSIGKNLNVWSNNSVSVKSGGSITLGGYMNVYSNTALLGDGTIAFNDASAVLSYNGPVDLSSDLVFQGAGSNTLAITDWGLNVDGSNSNQYVDFKFLRMTNSTISGVGSLDAFDKVYMTGGEISPGPANGQFETIGRLEIAGDVKASGTVYRAQVLETQWDELFFTGPSAVNLQDMDLNLFVAQVPTGNVATVMTADNGLANTFDATNLTVRPLLYDGILVVGANDVAVHVTPNNRAFSSALTLARQESVRAGFGGMKNSVFTRTKQLRRNLVATKHAIPQEAYLLANTNAPAGAMGPGDNNTIFDMHVWMQQFSGQGDYDSSGESYGFRLNKNGTTIGADRRFGEALTLGVNYTYARSDVRTSNADELDSETYWIGAYGEWVGTHGLYVDALLAGGFSSYDSIRREEAYFGEASYKSREFGAYADVGQYYHYGNLALSPYLGLHLLTSRADSHEEKEEGGSALVVEEDQRTWVESALGLKLRHRFDTRLGRFQTTGYAEWLHDFIDDDVSAEMSDEFISSLEMARIAPDADVFSTGLGLSVMTTDYMELGVGYNGRFSENYEEHSGSLMLDIMF